MTFKIFVTPLASIDIEDIVAYLAISNSDVALDFFDAVRITFADLARNPNIGVAYTSRDPALQNLRRWPVKGFDSYLIFYINAGDSLGERLGQRVEIVRVLHGKRDLEFALNQQ
jgi:toxin ParE1/3/4